MIYSAIVGGIDKPRKDVKCFTGTGKFSDPRLAAKSYKMLPHLYLDCEWSIWIDGNIRLFVDEKQLIKMTRPADIGVFAHEARDCVYEEGQACIEQNKDKPETINEQLNYYKDVLKYPRHNGLGYCGVIVRRNTSEINRLCEQWWAHICRFSIRDQISFPVVFGSKVKYLPKVPMLKNPYFKRPKHSQTWK